MSVEFDKDRKTWTVRWRETNKVTGEVSLRKKRGFRTKKEARLFEEEINELKEYSSFAQVMEEYLQSLHGYANDETIRGKKKILEKYASYLLPISVRSITKAKITQWRNGLSHLDISVTTKNRIMQIVKAISRYGADIYDYPDFAKGLRAFPKTSDDVQELRILSPVEFEKIMENVSNEVYKRFYIFLYHTGMRRGEAMALKKEDVDGDTVKITKSLRKLKTGTLKNASSKRTITLDKKAKESIEPLLQLEGEYVFGDHEHLSQTSITRIFEDALKKTGMEHYRIHDLRHSFISNAILNGADIVTVSRYVGHANVEQTLNRYSHLLKDSEKRLVKILNENT